MKASENRPAEQKAKAPDWSTTDQGDIFGDHLQTVLTIGLFAAIILAFLGICVPLFLM